MKAADLVKHFEGCRLTAYPDPGTGGEPYTIGYGHTGGVTEGEMITSIEADRLLEEDLRNAENHVKLYITAPLNQNQLAALTSLTFNIGAGNLKSSTLRTKLNARDYSGAAEEILRWNKAAGRVLPGLVKRRQAEHDLFLEVAP